MAAELDELYAAPLDEFTARRDALARELKDAGDKAAAAEVAKARKPSVAAWALNQLARAHPDDIEALSRLAEAMRSAGGDDLRQLMRERRDLVSRLTTATKQILRDADRSPDTHTNDIARSLEAASADAGAAAELGTGRLTGALEASGFGDWAAVTRTAKSKSATPEEDDEVDEEAERAAKAARKEAERALAAAEKDVAAAERERGKRQAAVDKAAAALADAQAALADAEREVDDARLAAADARAALDEP